MLKVRESQYKDNLLKKLLTLEETNLNAFWKTLNKLKELSSPKQNTDETITSEEWLRHFKDLGKRGTDFQLSGTDQIELTSREKELSDPQGWTNRAITISEVKSAVKLLKNNKSHSDDLILNEMLKSSSDILAPGITKLFNHVFSTGIYPEEWNIGYQVPIHKKEDTGDCNNYRGITITSCLGKLFNSTLNARLTKHLEETGKLSDNQAAYRKGYSTADHIFMLKCLINKYVRQN